MRRRLLLLVSASLVGVLAFIGTSSATEPTVEFPPGLSASDLSAVELPVETQLEIQNMLGEDLMAEYGISATSFDEVREVADTSAGELYAVPGTKGVCVVLLGAAASCGAPAAEEVVAVFAPDPSGEALVGGGVVLDGVGEVVVKAELESEVASAEIVTGGFEVTEELELSPSGGVEVETE